MSFAWDLWIRVLISTRPLPFEIVIPSYTLASTKRVLVASHRLAKTWHFCPSVRIPDKHYMLIPPVAYIFDICTPLVYVQETFGLRHQERRIFIAALFIKVKDCKSPKCPVNGEKKKYFFIYSHNGILYSRKCNWMIATNFNVD